MPAERCDLVVVCDFDATITEEDVCLALLAEFARDGWRQLDDEYEAGRITLEACLVGQVDLIDAPHETLVAYARERARVRQGFAGFVAFCRERGIPLAITSAGLDFYIEAILAREGLVDIDVTCIGTALNGGRVAVQLPLAGYQDLRSLGDFKAVAVRDYQAQGKRVVYVGDGATDFAAARGADHVFARDKLLAFCRREGIPCTPFADFDDVRRGVAELLTSAVAR